MKPIPISAAKQIAKTYGYDQVIIIARKVDRPAGVGETAKQAIQGGEHCTTYGVDEANCEAAARIGDHLKFDVMKWTQETVRQDHVHRPRAYEGENEESEK
jgi:hypothetical protein